MSEFVRLRRSSGIFPLIRLATEVQNCRQAGKVSQLQWVSTRWQPVHVERQFGDSAR